MRIPLKKSQLESGRGFPLGSVVAVLLGTIVACGGDAPSDEQHQLTDDVSDVRIDVSDIEPDDATIDVDLGSDSDAASGETEDPLIGFDALNYETGAFGLRELQLTGFEARPHPGQPGETIGFGGTVIDFDHDGDLDVFVGARAKSGNPACMFENQSSPGTITLVPVPEYCDSGDHAITGSAVDFDDDGRHELIIAELDRIRYIPDPEVPGESFIVLDDQCSALEVFPFDLNRDGVPEILAACAASDGVKAWEWNGGNDFSELELLPDANGSTEAVAVYDVNDDGLLDLQLGTITRTPSESDPNGAVELHRDPGGVYIRGFDGGFTKFLHGEGIDAYGDPMGFVRYWNTYEARYEFSYSDWGKNPVLRWHQAALMTVSQDIGRGVARHGDFLLASWAMLLDDFNRDHRDDVFMTQGQMFTQFLGGSSGTLGANKEHRNILLIQDELGTFEVTDDRDSVPGNKDVTEDMNFPHWSSRGALRVDLDSDGTLEILVFGLEGPVRVFQEFHDEPPPGRCTLVLISRYTFGFGFGFGIRSQPHAPFRAIESQGQYMVAASNWLTTVWPRGEVLFPSGHIERFDCTDGGAVLQVHEPAWISTTTAADSWSVEVDLTRHVAANSVDSVRAHCMDADSDQVFNFAPHDSVEDGRLRGEIDSDCAGIMLQAGDRYIDYLVRSPEH